MSEFGDDIRAAEQGLRDFKMDLSKAMTALADLKQLADRTRREADRNTRLAEDYEAQAIKLLQKMQQGELSAPEAETLASEALYQKGHHDVEAARLSAEVEKLEQSAGRTQTEVDRLKAAISQWERELLALKSRARTARTALTVGETAARFDPSGALARMERLKVRIEEDEALAEAYGQMSRQEALDEEIEKALAERPTDRAAEALKKLKKDMGIP